MVANEYQDIRNMSDEELKNYLSKNYFKKNSKSCLKCTRRARYNIKVENTTAFQTKKLCGLCEKHYQTLLRHLKVEDINWE